MGNLYSAWPDGTDEEDKNSSNRLLKKLKVALLIWLVTFIAALIWFSFAA